MKTYLWHDTCHKITAAFLDLFNNIVVKRYEDNVPRKEIKVPLKFWIPEKTRSRLLAFGVEEQTDGRTAVPELILPVMSAMLTGIERDSDRQIGKNEQRTITVIYDSDGKLEQVTLNYSPVPFNFSYTLSIWTKKATDLFQILENILPYFNPDVTVTIKELGYQLERDIPVSMSSGIKLSSLGDALDAKGPNREFKETVLDFTAKGVLYKAISVEGIIKQVIVDLIPYVDSLTQTTTGSRITVTGEELEDGEVTITETIEQYAS